MMRERRLGEMTEREVRWEEKVRVNLSGEIGWTR